MNSITINSLCCLIISSVANNVTIFDNIDYSLVIIGSFSLNSNLLLKFAADVVLQSVII